MKTVFILGAGASRQAGAPLMSDFLDVAEMLYRSDAGGVAEAKDEFADVFQAISDLRAIHQKAYLNLDNFETLFGAIEMANLTGRLASRDTASIKELRNSIVTLIFKTLENSIPFPVSQGNIRPPVPYDDFARMLIQLRKHFRDKSPKLSFLTFNYDLTLDYTLHYIKGWGGLDYCFSDDLNSRNYPLLKLHGSINWGVCQEKECGKIIPFNFDYLDSQPEHYYEGQTKHFFELGTNIDRTQHHGRPLGRTPVLVPPTWNKTEYHGELAHIWNRAARELAEAENVYVIGYSLPETDSFFRYLYALGSESETRIKRFWVFNPDPDGTVEPRFRAMIGRGIENRFRFVNGVDGTFENAIPVIERELYKV